MYKNKKFLGIIPARSGSKGLKDKNIRDFNGKPLMAHTIEAALMAKIFDKVIVSTDSEVYANVASTYGAQTVIRPTYLSQDASSTLDVIEYTLLNEIEEYDYFVLLQPTSPLRNHTHILDAINKVIETGSTSVVSVCKAEHSPMLMSTLEKSMSMDGFIKEKNNKRRQDLKTFYRINGSIYIMKVKDFIKTKNFYGENSTAFIMDNLSSVDIDNEIDFIIAECLQSKFGNMYDKSR